MPQSYRSQILDHLGLVAGMFAVMQLVGFTAQQVRDGMCQRGAAKRQGERAPGPICPATLAKHIVQWNVRQLEAVVNGAIGALAQVLLARPTGTRWSLIRAFWRAPICGGWTRRGFAAWSQPKGT